MSQHKVAKWQDPPEALPKPEKEPRYAWEVVGNECKAKTGKWALACQQYGGRFYSISPGMVLKSLAHSHPDDKFEVRVEAERDDRGFKQAALVYVRHVGPASPHRVSH